MWRYNFFYFKDKEGQQLPMQARQFLPSKYKQRTLTKGVMRTYSLSMAPNEVRIE